MLAATMTAPALASPTTATRTLPASVTPGAEFNVTIQASDCGSFGQVIENLPDGFTYVDCASDGIRVKQVDNAVKFTFLEDPTSFTYRVKAPNVAATTAYTFHGIVMDEDKNEYFIHDDDITVTASTPGPVTYVLTMAIDGDSSSTTPSVGNHTHDDGTVVDISATAGPGWQFDHWSGNVADPGSSPTTVLMDSDKTVTAYFSPTGEANPGYSIYTLTVTCQPGYGGNVTLSPPQEATGIDEPGEGVIRSTHDADTSIELAATPAENYVFSCWGGDLSGSTNPITTIMDSNKNITASFVLSPSDEADFAVSSFSISPEQVQPDQQVNICITITNPDGETGSYEAALYINGQLEDTRILEIAPGSSRDAAFGTSRATPGTYSVLLGGQQGQFTVVGSQSTGAGLDTSTRIAIVIMAALIAALVFVFRRVRKGA